MKKQFYTLACSLLLVVAAQAQTAFYNANTQLGTANLHSGCPMSVVDWNKDGLDDIIRLDQAHDCWVDVQRTNQTYQSIHLGDFGGSAGWAWAMVVADLDHNGYVDVVAGGTTSSLMKVLMTNNTGTAGVITSIANTSFFKQNLTLADFNNDGWVDVFACDDNAVAKMLLNTSGVLAVDTYVNFAVYPGSCGGGSDPCDSGNYGSAWVDFDNDGDLDLYIPHCRQSTTDTNDYRRWNRLFVNDGTNHYTDQASSFGLMSKWQTWTSSFGDIDNDGDFDVMLTNHDHACMILQNNGTGHFTEITSTTGFVNTIPMPMESVMEDFDNDGFVDIFIAGDFSEFHHNNGNGTYTKIPGLFNTSNMESFSIGDVDHDGFIDILGGYGSIYTTPSSVTDVLWKNKGNANHFITFDLRGTSTDASAVGTRVTLYGAWGKQIREVRAGESYGTTNSAQLHFGIGQATAIDSAVIHWTAGGHQTIVNPKIDQFVKVVENSCVSPEAIITSNQPFVVCPNSTNQITLSAPAGYTYLWSTGATTQTIQVSAVGDYNVTVSENGNACSSVSRTIHVTLNPDETPVINTIDPTDVCQGQVIHITAPAGAQSYLWSNGATTQNINVTESGTYTLHIEGTCQGWDSPNSVTVLVHIPTPVTVSDVTLTTPGTADLVATGGSNVAWYDVPTGGTALATGNTFTTPVLNQTTVYYVATSSEFGNASQSVGRNDAVTANYGASTTNAKVYFDVLDNCTLRSVKVYTDIAGPRTIELYNNVGAVINSTTITLPADSSVVDLNFVLMPGTGYSLGTNGASNTNNFGYVAPRLKRHAAGSVYPYTFTDVLSITGNTSGAAYFYYFYDWRVDQTPTICETRVPDSVFVDNTSGIYELVKGGQSVYPNPSTGLVNVSLGSVTAQAGTMTITDLLGQVVQSSALMLAKGNNVVEANLSNYPAGVYFIRMACPTGSFVVRATKQ